MDNNCAKCVRAAAVAGWWTLLIAAIFVTVQWLAYLMIMRAKPAWVLGLWGPDVTWQTVQTVALWLVGVFKLCLWLLALLVIWATIWAHKLRRCNGGG